VLATGIGLVQARVNGLAFMGRRSAPRRPRILFEAWVALVGLALIPLTVT